MLRLGRVFAHVRERTYRSSIYHALPNIHILQRDNALRAFLCRILKVKEATMCQNEPSFLPVLVFASFFSEIALVIRVEEHC